MKSSSSRSVNEWIVQNALSRRIERLAIVSETNADLLHMRKTKTNKLKI